MESAFFESFGAKVRKRYLCTLNNSLSRSEEFAEKRYSFLFDLDCFEAFPQEEVSRNDDGSKELGRVFKENCWRLMQGIALSRLDSFFLEIRNQSISKDFSLDDRNQFSWFKKTYFKSRCLNIPNLKNFKVNCLIECNLYGMMKEPVWKLPYQLLLNNFLEKKKIHYKRSKNFISFSLKNNFWRYW